MTRNWIVTLGAAVAATLATAAPASATATACCIPWQQPGEIAVSPDGTHVYASDYQMAVAVRVDPASGDLTLIDSYDTRASVAEMPPDGKHVYFADPRGPWFTRFERDASTGALSVIGGHEPVPGLPPLVSDMASSPDGRQIYAIHPGAGSISVLDRDPESGNLVFRGTVGLPIVDGEQRYNRPHTIELSPDGKHLYAKLSGQPSRIVTLARADDGSISITGSVECTWCSFSDFALAPDGRHLFDQMGPLTFDRDPVTGALSNQRENPNVPVGGGNEELPAGAMAVSHDGKSLYTVDHREGRLYASSIAPDGSITHQATYREAVDGFQGLRNITTVAVSPAGDFVFAASGVINNELGHIAVFRRDPATGALTFADVIDGPDPRTGPGPEGPLAPTITINDGATYTNDPDVTVKFGGLGGRTIPFVTLSNDGGFGAAENRWATTGHVYRWKLASSGPERLPKTVYARLGGPFTGTVTDDIILDERDPVVQYVETPRPSTSKRKSRDVRLKVRARDTLSGLSQLQVTTNKRRPGAWKKYTSKPVMRATNRAVYVRVRDRAGNSSRWLKAKKAKVRR